MLNTGSMDRTTRARTRAARLFLAAGAVAVLMRGSAGAQPAKAGGLKDRLAAVKQAAAENQQKLRQYMWTETQQVSLKGEVKSTKQMSCSYAPDGKPQCTPTGPPPAQKRTGPLRERAIEKKTEELTAYMQQVKGVIGMYVPPDPARMQAAWASGNASLSTPAAGEAAIILKNYALPGDSMSLDFAMAAKKLSGLSVNTYVGDPSSPVTMSVQFAPLPDGTNYPAQVVVNAPAKGIQVTVTNSNYQKFAKQ
jgi:hypothetical protein